jgi:16S rRNA processing protein RimM
VTTGERDRATSPEHLVVGHITKAHGTKGELLVWSLTDRAGEVFAPGQSVLVGDDEGALPPDAPYLVVERSRPFRQGLLVKFEAIDDRDDADAVVRRYLLAPAAALPPLEQDEMLYHELLGCAVETVAGERVGTVREVFETEPHHLLEVKSDDGRLHLVPFAARIVRSIDRDGRRIVIEPPDGLLEL